MKWQKCSILDSYSLFDDDNQLEYNYSGSNKKKQQQKKPIW